MINSEVSHLLRDKWGSKDLENLTAKRIKIDYGPMSSNDAYYVLAHLSDIDLSQYLPLADIDRIRSLVPRDKRISPVFTKKGKTKTRKTQTYPLVSTKTISIAERIGEDLYPLLFVLESSIRELISTRLSKSPDWWEKKVPDGVQKNVAATMKSEKRYPYRDKRGTHPLSYANFKDLRLIIEGNTQEFSNVILDMEWFKAEMKKIYMVRNNIAHCVPITPDDRTRLAVFHRDWARLLGTAGIK
ncbi:MAG: Swt1 family HEPN domain-containing protein [Chloroflexi bacterium]|nr:Swt1 family HEPN domain-containing protein [Chloroflexota bacterium]